MTEYIERKALLELINEDCKYKNPTNEYTRGCNEVCNWAIKMIKNMPTADVVPKSKYDLAVAEREANVKGFTEELAKVKTNVASKIFEDIEREINDALQSNSRVLPQIEESEALWNRVNGKIDALRGIDGFVEELKKKYGELK